MQSPIWPAAWPAFRLLTSQLTQTSINDQTENQRGCYPSRPFPPDNRPNRTATIAPSLHHLIQLLIERLLIIIESISLTKQPQPSLPFPGRVAHAIPFPPIESRRRPPPPPPPPTSSAPPSDPRRAMQHGDYASSAPPAAGHYYPHQFAPNPPPHPASSAADAAPPTIPASYASAPPYSVGGYSDQPPSAPSYAPPPQYAGYAPPYNNPNPAPYPPESSPAPAPYYSYPPTAAGAATQHAPAAEPSPAPLPYDAPYYGGYQPPPTAGYGDDDYLNEGAYAYSGDGGSEPYGARGTAPTRSGAAMFDDYGRSIGPSSGGADQWPTGGGGGVGGSFGKIARAVPKAESHEDANGGAQKFRVKLLPEGAGSPTDVLCQVW